MSFLESPKNRLAILGPTLAAASNRSFRLKPGCVQCGNLLEISDHCKANFSGKCFSCEHWVSDEDDVFDEWED